MRTNPELFSCRRLPVQVNVSGIGRNQTLVDQRTSTGEDETAGLSEPWPLVNAALDLDLDLDLDVDAAAAEFVRIIDSYS